MLCRSVRNDVCFTNIVLETELLGWTLGTKTFFVKYQVAVFMLNHVGVDISDPKVVGANHCKTNGTV